MAWQHLTTELGRMAQVIVLGLVDAPDEVRIEERWQGETLELVAKVAGTDLGKVIGKGGRTAMSVRTVLQACAKRKGLKYSFDVEAVS